MIILTFSLVAFRKTSYLLVLFSLRYLFMSFSSTCVVSFSFLEKARHYQSLPIYEGEAAHSTRRRHAALYLLRNS